MITAVKKKYQARDGFKISDKQAEQYGERIDELGIGGLEYDKAAAVVLNDAAKKRSPLHDYFEWDDTVAAYKHRMEQARYLMRAIEIVVEIKGKEIPMRAWDVIITPGKSEKLCASSDMLLTNDGLRALKVRQALKEAQSWRKRYNNYSELDKIAKAIDDVIDGFEN